MYEFIKLPELSYYNPENTPKYSQNSNLLKDVIDNLVHILASRNISVVETLQETKGLSRSQVLIGLLELCDTHNIKIELRGI